MFATCSAGPSVWLAARSSVGMTRPRRVPGSTVERITTRCGAVAPRAAAPISSQTRATAARSRLPLRREGVPTQTRLSSAAATAARASVVARRRPSATVAAISSPTRASTIGLLAAVTSATFSGLRSTPTTACPSRARQAADTIPT